MRWTRDRAVDVVFWGGVSCLLAYVLGLQCPLNFWLLLTVIWASSAGIYLYFSSLTLPTEMKCVLITGCDTGIGYALALHLHDQGFRVFAGCLLADTGGEGAQQLRRLGSSRLHVLQMDVTQQEQIEDALQQTKKLIPDGEGLWAVVNNAGVTAFGEVEWVPLDTYRRITDINLFGLIGVTKAFLPLVRRSQGRVVNIASVCGHITRAGLSPYVLSKFAMEGFSDCLRHEMKPWGVDVCIIEPCNYSAATQITTEELVLRQGDTMWSNMDDCVKEDYGREYFDFVVNIAKMHCNSGLSDIRPVLESITEAVTQKYPRARYRPITNYYFVKLFIATHLPEWVFSFFYTSSKRRLPR
ncbi:D-beta-hydroxybutyrate dehydrogenase, mitochondrial-like [Macrobrachium rosenbergii]|uniref:D-beta-hydroxybutyrate dehydrogenase, mitochondrial-like n=1 Tax=Macrobrachium rosenbergii TaxID=79674 RepID=UPI0034D60166